MTGVVAVLAVGGELGFLNPNDKSVNVVLSENNRRAQGATGVFVRGVSGRSAGSFYYELESGGDSTVLGLAIRSKSVETNLLDAGAVGSQGFGAFRINGVDVAGPGAHPVGSILGFAVNLTTRRLWIRNSHQGTGWFGGGDPAAQTGGYDISSLTGGLHPALNIGIYRPSARTWLGAAPAGFAPWG